MSAIRRRVGRLVGRGQPPGESGHAQPPTTLDAYYGQSNSCQIADLWFLYSRFLGDRTSGSFVEIGAFDGVSYSNTWGLAERGWRGLMVEPVPDFAERCRRAHAGHPSVTVVQSAIGPADTTEITLKLAGELSTANRQIHETYSQLAWSSTYVSDHEVSVPSQTLDALLYSHDIAPGFDLLSVDVEGFEEVVFSAFDLDRWAPHLIIIELADTHPELTATAISDAGVAERITNSGYRVVFKDRINTVFVRLDVWRKAFQLD